MAHVALSMLGHVHEQAAKCGRQLFPADYARGGKVRGGQRTNTLGASVEGEVEFGEKLVTRDIAVLLGFQLPELGGAKRRIFSISEQAVEAARDVPELKSDRRETVRMFMELGIGQRGTPFPKIFSCEFEGVEGGTRYGTKIRVRTPEPWLCGG